MFNEDLKNVSLNSDLETQPVLVINDLERYLRVQIVNNAIREIFLNQFAHMFSVYEYFFSQPNQVYNPLMFTLLSTRNYILFFIGHGFMAVKPRSSSSI